MRVLVLLGAAAALLAATVPGPAVAQGPGSQAVVLLHHPYDKVDPFGVPFGGGDTFSARHYAASAEGTFAFPTFVADGVLPVTSIPDPSAPYISTLANYTSRVESRLAMGSPGTLTLRGTVQGESLQVEVAFLPSAPLADPQHPDAIHLFVAVVEDFIHYQPDPRVSNGVVDHRLTVRALQDLGPVDLSQGQAVRGGHAFALGGAWSGDNLIVAAWLEAQAPFGRFGAGEVLQAAWASADGTDVVQSEKAVLVEVYSATWCTPCLYGDEAAKDLAVQYGKAAQAAAPGGPKYFRAPETPTLAAGATLAACVVIGAWAWRRRAA